MPAKATDQLRRASVSAAPPRTKLRGFLNALPHQLRLAIFSLALLSFLLALFPFSVDFSVPLPPRATTGHNTSFVSYLDAHFPTTSKQGLGLGLFRRKELTPHVWLTMAGEAWVDTGTAALDVFVQRLNVEREIKYGVGVKRKTVLVVLCLDAGCVAACERRGLYGYYGYEHTRPEEVRDPEYHCCSTDASCRSCTSCAACSRVADVPQRLDVAQASECVSGYPLSPS